MKRFSNIEISLHNTAVRRQNALTLISEIVEESDFSETACNFAYVSDVKSLIAKSTLQQFFGYNFLTQDRNCLMK